MNRRPLSSTRKAFSLPEFLVVVALVSILTALAMAAYQKARGASLQTRCLSNLRTLYISMLGFTEDHNGKLPPTLGPAAAIDSGYTFNQYWFGQAYLGRYAIGPMNRRQDAVGNFTQKEAEIYNCPARLSERPDRPQSNGNPGISYLMVSFYPKNPSPGAVPPARYLFRVMENKANTLLLTEGRGLLLSQANTVTRPFRDDRTGLRRFHGQVVNTLFLDGHAEAFSGADEELVKKHPQ